LTRWNQYQFGAANLCSTANVTLSVRDSVIMGVSMWFDPLKGRHHTVRNNVFFGGHECQHGCPTQRMIRLGLGAGTLDVQDNVAYGGTGNWLITAKCSQFEGDGHWRNNGAMGAFVGYDLQGGQACTRLRLTPYRNSAGITTSAPTLSNVVAAENGMAIVPAKWSTIPDVIPMLVGEILQGGPELDLITDSVIIGR